jgi:hypothetical protein
VLPLVRAAIRVNRIGSSYVAAFCANLSPLETLSRRRLLRGRVELPTTAGPDRRCRRDRDVGRELVVHVDDDEVAARLAEDDADVVRRLELVPGGDLVGEQDAPKHRMRPSGRWLGGFVRLWPRFLTWLSAPHRIHPRARRRASEMIYHRRETRRRARFLALVATVGCRPREKHDARQTRHQCLRPC